MKEIEVVGAVIERNGLIFCAQRGSGPLAGMWEFPGGKVESGESPEEALTREIAEELSCVIRVGARVVTASHEYEFGVVTMTTFLCALESGEPRLSEHAAAEWRSPHALRHLEWAPVDLPTVAALQADAYAAANSS